MINKTLTSSALLSQYIIGFNDDDDDSEEKHVTK